MAEKDTTTTTHLPSKGTKKAPVKGTKKSLNANISKTSETSVVAPIQPQPQPTLETQQPQQQPPKVMYEERHNLSDYRCYNLPNIKNLYLKLLNDNIMSLISHIYDHSDQEPYQSPEVRIALSMQMILSSDKLIPVSLSSLIARDLEDLKKDDTYTSQWVNPTLKRRTLARDLEILRKHTEIDDSVSLNLSNFGDVESKVNAEDYDIKSGVSTLNVSAVLPIKEEEGGNCLLM